MTSIQETVLVTGVTRGIGAQLLSQLLARGNTRIIAGVRDLNADSAKSLLNQSQTNKNLIVVKIDSESQTDPRDAANILRGQHGIDHIDLIIANAGISTDWSSVLEVKPENLLHSVNVNVVAPLLLFQAFEPFLIKSNNPRILFVSTAIASLGMATQIPWNSTTYGGSKVALNFLARRISIEHPHITSTTLHPGLVKTDMSSSLESDVSKALAEGRAILPDASARAILKLADEAKINTHSGRFFDAPSGQELPW